MNSIHPTAILEGEITLGQDVKIGAYSVIQGQVTIGDGTVIADHVHIEGRTTIGARNRIQPFTSIGTPPQDLKYAGEDTAVEIGDDNVIKEFVSINRGTVGGGGVTRLGSHCFLMVYAHIAHDCQVGDNVLFANAATLAGHVTVGERATVGAFCAVHQFCKVGPYAFIGGCSTITRDVLPFIKTVGSRSESHIYGINTIGLQRLGFSEERIENLKKAYRLLFRSSPVLSQGLEAVRNSLTIEGDVKVLVDFIESSHRGVIR